MFAPSLNLAERLTESKLSTNGRIQRSLEEERVSWLSNTPSKRVALSVLRFAAGNYVIGQFSFQSAHPSPELDCTHSGALAPAPAPAPASAPTPFVYQFKAGRRLIRRYAFINSLCAALTCRCVIARTQPLIDIGLTRNHGTVSHLQADILSHRREVNELANERLISLAQYLRQEGRWSECFSLDHKRSGVSKASRPGRAEEANDPQTRGRYGKRYTGAVVAAASVSIPLNACTQSNCYDLGGACMCVYVCVCFECESYPVMSGPSRLDAFAGKQLN